MNERPARSGLEPLAQAEESVPPSRPRTLRTAVRVEHFAAAAFDCGVYAFLQQVSGAGLRSWDLA